MIVLKGVSEHEINVGVKLHEGIGLLFQKASILFLTNLLNLAVFSGKTLADPGKKYK